MITEAELMLWELTIISLLIGMLLGAVGTIAAMKIINKIAALEEEVRKHRSQKDKTEEH